MDPSKLGKSKSRKKRIRPLPPKRNRRQRQVVGGGTLPSSASSGRLTLLGTLRPTDVAAWMAEHGADDVQDVEAGEEEEEEEEHEEESNSSGHDDDDDDGDDDDARFSSARDLLDTMHPHVIAFEVADLHAAVQHLNELAGLVDAHSAAAGKLARLRTLLLDEGHEVVVSQRALSESRSGARVLVEYDPTIRSPIDHIDTLLNWPALAWDFAASARVGLYRAAAMASTSHAPETRYQQWELPSISSEQPLPDDVVNENMLVTCLVLLPEETLPPGASLAIKSTRVVVRLQDSPADVIARVVRKCGAGVLEPLQDDLVLKARGLIEFVTQPVVLDSMYVRSRIRLRRTPELCLMRRSEWLRTVAANDVHLDTTEREDAYAESVADLPKPQPSSDEVLLSTIDSPFTLSIQGVAELPKWLPKHDTLCASVFLIHGMTVLPGSVAHFNIPSETVELAPSLPLKRVPRATRLAVLLCSPSAASSPARLRVLGWCCVPLVDEHDTLLQGLHTLRLWAAADSIAEAPEIPRSLDTSSSVAVNFLTSAPPYPNGFVNAGAGHTTVAVRVAEHGQPVRAPLDPLPQSPDPGLVHTIPWEQMSAKDRRQVKDVVYAPDPFRFPQGTLIPDSTRALLWSTRVAVALRFPRSLALLLQCVDWTDPAQRVEAHRLLSMWSRADLTAVDALKLLGPEFADYRVREFAVSLFDERATDLEVQLYLPQLVECIKHELYHDSPLVRLLIRRALASPHLVANDLFWALRCACTGRHASRFCERYALVLEELLSFCGRYVQEFQKQVSALDRFAKLSHKVTRWRESGIDALEIKTLFRESIETMNMNLFARMSGLRLPTNPRLEVTMLNPRGCRYMSSHQAPLWLEFRRPDGVHEDSELGNVFVMYKAGDDLRQDVLTIQMLRLMDRLWLGAGLDLHMLTYRVVPTDEDSGLIEIVPKASTQGEIQRTFGGHTGAFRTHVIDDYLVKFNQGSGVDGAKENFLRSAAGYSVASFVLGLADRHADNLMITQRGSFFHIDFGHFLGHSLTTKFGVSRERDAFPFSPAMAYVIGGEDYLQSANFQRFQDYCVRAYLVLRHNAEAFVTLFRLMLTANIPELQSEADVGYLQTAFRLDLDDDDAQEHFKRLLHDSLDTTSRRFDDFMHNLRQFYSS